MLRFPTRGVRDALGAAMLCVVFVAWGAQAVEAWSLFPIFEDDPIAYVQIEQEIHVVAASRAADLAAATGSAPVLTSMRALLSSMPPLSNEDRRPLHMLDCAAAGGAQQLLADVGYGGGQAAAPLEGFQDAVVYR